MWIDTTQQSEGSACNNGRRRVRRRRVSYSQKSGKMCVEIEVGAEGDTGVISGVRSGGKCGQQQHRRREGRNSGKKCGKSEDEHMQVHNGVISSPIEGPLPVAELMRSISSIRFSRAGVIPYTMVGRTIYFCVGVDTATGEYTDFGGGYSPRRDKDGVETALRELREESQLIFNANYGQIENGWYVRSNSDLVLFLRCDCSVAFASGSLFRQRVRTTKRPEVKAIAWLTSMELLLELRGSKFYSRVRSLLQPRADLLVEILTYESYHRVYNRVGKSCTISQ